MSALILLKSSLSRLPQSVARQVVGCSYHTERGVYGYRPKSTERDQKWQSERVAALNQGQYGVKLQYGPLKLPSFNIEARQRPLH